MAVTVGAGERLRDAEERHEAFFREQPHLNNRDWLIAAFEHLAGANETAAGLFDRRHNPLWELTPSYEAATELLAFWRRRGSDDGPYPCELGGHRTRPRWVGAERGHRHRRPAPRREAPRLL
jgi:hypothetical protein